jgi:Transposase DDE domain group 1
MSYAMIDIHCASYPRPPREVTLDIDDTLDVAHGAQQLSLFNTHHGERCFLPIHVYDTATARPVAVLLRSGKTPSGREVRGHIRRIVRRIRAHWPDTKLTIRGDSHYGRHEAMAWCEANGVDYIFGFGGNDVLDRLVEPAADDVRVRYAEGDMPTVRRYAETRYGAKSWNRVRRVAARIEATCNGLDIRHVMTNLRRGSAEWLYDTLYCERGQAENLIKPHKSQLASDRTSCRSPLANQVRLVLHTAAYWLMLAVRDAIPQPQPLASAEFTTLRLRLIKVAARVIETATRVRIAFASSCPEAELFGGIARWFQPAAP